MNPKVFLVLTLLLSALAGGTAAAGQPLPLPRTLWISGDPADLAPLAGTTWEFTTYLEGADPASMTVIFTDSIRINEGTGSAVLGTMYPDCEPLPSPIGPLYEICGGTMYVQFSPGQLDLFGNLSDFGYGAVLFSENGQIMTWYWFNIFENGLDEPALAIGYSEFAIQGLFYPPTLLEGRRIFSDDDIPPLETDPDGPEPGE